MTEPSPPGTSDIRAGGLGWLSVKGDTTSGATGLEGLEHAGELENLRRQHLTPGSGAFRSEVGVSAGWGLEMLTLAQGQAPYLDFTSMISFDCHGYSASAPLTIWAVRLGPLF